MSTSSERERQREQSSSSAESEKTTAGSTTTPPERTTATIAAEEEKTAQTAAQFINTVTEATSLEDSIAKLIEGLKNQLTEALKGIVLTPATKQRVDGVFSQIGKDKTALAKAVVANTPAQHVPGNSRSS